VGEQLPIAIALASCDHLQDAYYHGQGLPKVMPHRSQKPRFRPTQLLGSIPLRSESTFSLFGNFKREDELCGQLGHDPHMLGIELMLIVMRYNPDRGQRYPARIIEWDNEGFDDRGLNLIEIVE
jgi:hypothetical protein